MKITSRSSEPLVTKVLDQSYSSRFSWVYVRGMLKSGDWLILDFTNRTSKIIIIREKHESARHNEKSGSMRELHATSLLKRIGTNLMLNEVRVQKLKR